MAVLEGLRATCRPRATRASSPTTKSWGTTAITTLRRTGGFSSDDAGLWELFPTSTPEIVEASQPPAIAQATTSGRRIRTTGP
jgi:hypothetical protein